MAGKTVPDNDALLEAPVHVLSTMEQDGSRRWLSPKLSTGAWWKRRRVVAYLLMVIFVLLPHIKIGGKPAVLLDIGAKKFTVLGQTFLPTDTLLLGLLILCVIFSIMLITTLAGRVWCGWACPQTVYMEFLFRPIDRLFQGTAGKGGKPKRAVSALLFFGRFAVYLLLCGFLAHTFLAYFVGVEQLAVWMRRSPVEHPVSFMVMSATVGLMLFDFMFFREQLCTIACPYGRFQSVMLDQQSLIVAYDPERGEPRQKGKRHEGDVAGDCVDCNQCVVVCPTGIDIRQGLQMECINCTQCIDACDDVMTKVGKPTGLIRYGSQESIAGKARNLLRFRTVIYPLVLLVLFSGLVFAISSRSGFDARILPAKAGAPFTKFDDGTVSNEFKLRLVNRTDEQQTYTVNPAEKTSVEIEVIDPSMMTLEPGDSVLVPIHVTFPMGFTRNGGRQRTYMTVEDQQDQQRRLEYTLRGPG